MITFITVEDVNSILGATWTDESKKAKSVLMANTWMNGLNLKMPCNKATHEIIIPDDVETSWRLCGASGLEWWPLSAENRFWCVAE
ncbi:hypothetical protein LNP26_29775 [Klebsiella variicola subsp. variicola]|nr:hypothetical protein [Klebsiella variicola subsp. variicola]